MAEMPTYQGVHHVGITVPDLEEAERFFMELLGCSLFYREGPFRDDDSDSMSVELGVDARATLRTSVLTDRSGTLIELLQYDLPSGSATEPPANSSNSACHLALTVDDIDRAVAHLRVIPGVELLRGPATTEGGPSDGMRWIYCAAPWGLTLELVQLPSQLASGPASNPE
jgi:catechol 2,3-dioxygenase-like lactoylglutathione lyase family enzyme